MSHLGAREWDILILIWYGDKFGLWVLPASFFHLIPFGCGRVWRCVAENNGAAVSGVWGFK
jgi:hypothetical protein